MLHFPEYDIYDGIGLAELIRTKAVSREEVLEAAIERIELLNPFLNAVTFKLYDQAKKQIQSENLSGPFAGVPFLIKDIGLSYANTPTDFGSVWLKGYTRPFHSELIQRYLKAGLVILGKTNTPEFGLSPVTEPRLHGKTVNPWDLTRTAGGSSGGSAAAVGGRMVPMAQGGDGGGSIRIPASCCGLFGLKPTRGRTPRGPDAGRGWLGLVVDHALTRSVRDSAALLDATLGDDMGTPLPLPSPKESYLEMLEQSPGPLKIGVLREPIYPTQVDPDCFKALDNAISLCSELKHTVEEARLELDPEEQSKAMLILIAAEMGKALHYFKRVIGHAPRWGEVEITTRVLAKLGRYYKAEDLAWALSVFDKTTRKVGALHEKYDVLLTPTLAKLPLKNETLKLAWYENWLLHCLNATGTVELIHLMGMRGIRKNNEFSPYTALFNLTGQPAMSIPLYWNRQNLPVGVQFAGRYGDETVLFQLARQLEKARPWQHRLPSRS